MKTRFTSTISRATMLLLMMVFTTASAWAQDPQEPNLGYIVCDPANVIGGSLSFYKSLDSETVYKYEIVIDGTTHQSEGLYSDKDFSIDGYAIGVCNELRQALECLVGE